MSEAKGGVRRNMEDRVDDLEERLRAAVEFKSDFGDKGGQCTLSVLLDRMCAWLPPLGSSRIQAQGARTWATRPRGTCRPLAVYLPTRAYVHGGSSAFGAGFQGSL